MQGPGKVLCIKQCLRPLVHPLLIQVTNVRVLGIMYSRQGRPQETARVTLTGRKGCGRHR
jgi:hypothetical protein